MRGISKTMLRTCAGLAVSAALVVGGAGVASAATAPAAHAGGSWVHHCNPWQREQWNLNGPNHVEAVYQGKTYTYSVTFRQFGSCLSGTLTDGYYPTTGPIYGTIYGNHVVFSFRYPPGSIQGVRTYDGYINWWWGWVHGKWSETGSENASGTFTLAKHANRACWWWWWHRNGSCRVFPPR
jgi:hypothetical protein